MKQERYLPIPQIIILMGMVVAEAYIAYGYIAEGNIKGAITIFIVLIGVVGGAWAQFVQFKRDAGEIDVVNNNIDEVKSDTSEMIKIINENVKKVRDEVVEKIVPNLGKLEGITTLVDAYKVEQAIKKRQSPNLTDLIDDYGRALQKINQMELEKMALEKQLHENKLEKSMSKKQDVDCEVENIK